MYVLEQRFQVSYQYNVYFTEHLFSGDNTVLSEFFTAQVQEGHVSRALMVIDEGVLEKRRDLLAHIRACFERLSDTVKLVPEIVTVPGGEQVKNSDVYVGRLIDAIDRYGVDRHSYLIAVGGGAVLDMAGYAAAIAHRGVRHIRIPTTVLSQNDSGIGVKNGINYQGKKNFLGTFVPPAAVINDAAFLETLDDRDWRAGISEAVKVALIKDRAFFDWIGDNVVRLVMRDAEAMSYLIRRCADLHMQHIRSGDPFESGSSRPLDFGHWAAHKLEYLTMFSLRHGEAVAIGIALDSVYSMKKGLISREDTHRILYVLQALGFELYHPRLSEDDKIHLKEGLREFREHLGGRLTITLLEALGKGVEVHDMDEQMIASSVDYLQTTAAQLPSLLG